MSTLGREGEPMVNPSRCASCLERKLTNTILCDKCIRESARTSHRLDGHARQRILGCPACEAFARLP